MAPVVALAIILAVIIFTAFFAVLLLAALVRYYFRVEEGATTAPPAGVAVAGPGPPAARRERWRYGSRRERLLRRMCCRGRFWRRGAALCSPPLDEGAETLLLHAPVPARPSRLKPCAMGAASQIMRPVYEPRSADKALRRPDHESSHEV